MFELNNILIAALTEAGVTARSAMENKTITRPREAVCTVCLAASDVTDTAFGQYLGTLDDPERGELPLYGRRFQTEAELSCFAPECAEDCDAAVKTVLDTLLSLEGLRVNGFSLSPCSYDDTAGAFTRTVRVQIAGLLYCLQLDDEGTFSDFTLLPTII